jgi:hypothetical protein
MQYISQITEREHYCETIPAAKTLENNGEYGGREYYQIFSIKGTTCKTVQLYVTYCTAKHAMNNREIFNFTDILQNCFSFLR